jgi:hypothetical protein
MCGVAMTTIFFCHWFRSYTTVDHLWILRITWSHPFCLFPDFVYYLCFSRFCLLSLFFDILFNIFVFRDFVYNLAGLYPGNPFSNINIRFKVRPMSMAISLIFKSISSWCCCCFYVPATKWPGHIVLPMQVRHSIIPK